MIRIPDLIAKRLQGSMTVETESQDIDPGLTGTIANTPSTPNATLAQLAVGKLRKMIEDGELVAGEALVAQRQLARELNVSRATLREALSILATVGLVSIEPGRGTFVRDPNTVAESGSAMSWRFSARYSPAEVYQVRYIVESQAAQLAATTLTAPEIGLLKDNLQAFRTAAQQFDVEAFAQVDFEFHAMIMRFSRNRLLSDIHHSYANVLIESTRLPITREKLWDPVAEHERIVEALVMNDPEGAGYYMRRHLSRTAHRAGVSIVERV
jgi:GntR family transcriptional repressor for pyruvate dehydrogenase complex